MCCLHGRRVECVVVPPSVSTEALRKSRKVNDWANLPLMRADAVETVKIVELAVKEMEVWHGADCERREFLAISVASSEQNM